MAICGDGRSNLVSDNSLHDLAELNPILQDSGRLRQFDFVMTNPPYGTKTKVLASEAKNFQLGHSWRWHKPTASWVKNRPRDTDPYALFIERCLDLVKEGGLLAIVLPETVFHAPTKRRLRSYITERGSIEAIVSLPHNTFRPHCNAKTCLLVVRKGGRPSGVIMAHPREMGHNHKGAPLYRYGSSEEIWDDLPIVANEVAYPDEPDNKLVFTVPWREVEATDIWIPKYHQFYQSTISPPSGRYWVPIDELITSGILKFWPGHGSPPATEKGQGNIPYIRVSDIVGWELYRNPTTGVPEHVYNTFVEKKRQVHTLQTGDVLFVQRGSYRIGTVAIASPYDSKVVLTKELLTFRITPENDLGLTPYYLLALLASGPVQKQLEHLIFVDTTLPTIRDRWKELRLPVHKDRQKMLQLSSQVESVFAEKWAAQGKIRELRQDLGRMVV